MNDSMHTKLPMAWSPPGPIAVVAKLRAAIKRAPKRRFVYRVRRWIANHLCRLAIWICSDVL